MRFTEGTLSLQGDDRGAAEVGPVAQGQFGAGALPFENNDLVLVRSVVPEGSGA